MSYIPYGRDNKLLSYLLDKKTEKNINNLDRTIKNFKNDLNLLTNSLETHTATTTDVHGVSQIVGVEEQQLLKNKSFCFFGNTPQRIEYEIATLQSPYTVTTTSTTFLSVTVPKDNYDVLDRFSFKVLVTQSAAPLVVFKFFLNNVNLDDVTFNSNVIIYPVNMEFIIISKASNGTIRKLMDNTFQDYTVNTSGDLVFVMKAYKTSTSYNGVIRNAYIRFIT